MMDSRVELIVSDFIEIISVVGVLFWLIIQLQSHRQALRWSEQEREIINTTIHEQAELP